MNYKNYIKQYGKQTISKVCDILEKKKKHVCSDEFKKMLNEERNRKRVH